jgi:hypothetical protein
MLTSITLFFLFFTNVATTLLKNHWTCIGVSHLIDFTKPYTVNVGELPLVLWKDSQNKLITTINVCKHMGSKLGNGIITPSGCLQCQYHGLELGEKDKFGETIEHEGKIFWSLNPVNKKPPSVPFFHNPSFKNSVIVVDMPASLTDSAYNTMDLRHPEFVHSSKVAGFGNSIPPQNVKQYKYLSGDRVGLSFDYSANSVVKRISENTLKTQNFHMFVYPTFSWSRVTFEKSGKSKHIIIGVNLLPLAEKKTRWFVTVCHNYHTGIFGKEIMKKIAMVILAQDFFQMLNQQEEGGLKKKLLFQHTFSDEDVILWVRYMLVNYTYPKVDDFL